MRKLTLLTLVAALTATGAAFAQLSPQYSEFGDGPAQYLMTADEQREWAAVGTDQEAERFIALFWARRDPTPATPQNEFRDNFFSRVEYADANFGEARTRGAMTERGRVLILVGPPSKRQRSGVEVNNVATPTEFGDTSDARLRAEGKRPTETWVYEAERVPPFARTRADFQISFVDQNQNGQFRMNRGGRSDPGDLMNRAVATAVVNPDVTWEQLQSRQAVTPATAAEEVAQRPAAFSNDAIRSLVSGFRKDPKATAGTYLTWGEYITGEGEYFVPVQFYLPEQVGVAAGTELVLFGEIRDAEGNVVRVVETPVTATESRRSVYAATSLDLEPGQKYDAVLGLYDGSRAVAITREELELEGVTDDEPSISQLILSDHIYPLSEAQAANDPYSFGGLRVVPRGDRTFRTDQELWYFYEVRNPSLGEDGQPSLQSSVEVQYTVDGQKRTKRSPLSEVDPQPLKGVEHHYAVGSSIPLSGFTPGTHTITVKVIDAAQRPTRSWTRTETFEVVSAD